jgi:hypothetical protein
MHPRIATWNSIHTDVRPKANAKLCQTLRNSAKRNLQPLDLNSSKLILVTTVSPQ